MVSKWSLIAWILRKQEDHYRTLVYVIHLKLCSIAPVLKCISCNRMRLSKGKILAATKGITTKSGIHMPESVLQESLAFTCLNQ